MTDWQIPKMWEGGECWIIGGGPSIATQFEVPEDVVQGVFSDELPLSAYSSYLSPIHDRHVIGVNAAFLIGDWMDVIFFGDGGFYFQNKTKLNQYAKLKVTCNPNLRNKENVQGVKLVPRNGRHPEGISAKPNTVSWNLNSGGCAINLAYHFGVKRIYLLGFDMTLGADGSQHWHRHYFRSKNGRKQRNQKNLPFERHLRNFPAIAKDAESLGLEIINVSPESGITVFKRVKLSDVI